MRISDWSSDVCSSDLEAAGHVGRERRRAAGFGQLRDQRRRHGAPDGLAVGAPRPRLGAEIGERSNRMRVLGLDPGLRQTGWGVIDADGNHLKYVANGVVVSDRKADLRSEAHTSELQSLVRNSNAVSY